MAIVRVDTELIDHLEGVFAPVLDVDEGVVKRRSVIAGEAVALTKGAGCSENIGRDDLFEQTLKFKTRSKQVSRG